MTADTNQPDENKLIAERRAKLDKVRAGGIAFPNDFRRDALADQLLTAYGDRPTEWFEQHTINVTVGGRMMVKRVMGKASFAKIMDRSGEIQLFLQSATLGGVYDDFKTWDVGDILDGDPQRGPGSGEDGSRNDHAEYTKGTPSVTLTRRESTRVTPTSTRFCVLRM